MKEGVAMEGPECWNRLIDRTGLNSIAVDMRCQIMRCQFTVAEGGRKFSFLLRHFEKGNQNEIESKRQ